jgi:uracil-DNA glycosylase
MIPAPPDDWANLPFFSGLWPDLRSRLEAAPDWQPADPFRALRLTPRAACRVVILGQDPYPTPGRATGLAFDFPPAERPRDSLRNIFTEVQADLGQPPPDDLSGWARQGVLLLNTVLTVPLGEPHGHKGWGWETLVLQVLNALAVEAPRAFVLWGGAAQRLCADLPRKGHLFVQSAHPSPLSARRGFFGSRPFSRVNDWLVAQGQPRVDWAQ